MPNRNSMTSRSTRAHHASNRESPGFYKRLLTAQELSLLEQPATLEDEQKLLRSRVLRLARKITVRGDADKQLSSIRALVLMIQAIATLERVIVLTRARAGGTDPAILEALTELDPYEEL
jgi:hypothetical protein